MSSSDRRTLLGLLAALPLAACGFTPAYGPSSPARELFDRVAVDAPTDKNAFDFVSRIEERLGRPEGATFRLSYTIGTKASALAIARTNAITRYRLEGSVSFRLMSTRDDTVLTSGEVASFTSYSASSTSLATAVSRDDAKTRLMILLADQVVTRLIATAPAWKVK